jgi:hypothetical protein
MKAKAQEDEAEQNRDPRQAAANGPETMPESLSIFARVKRVLVNEQC